MKLQIKKSGGIPFARKAPYEYDGTKYEADLKNGDVVTILDAGIEEEGQFGKQYNFRIKTRNGEKKQSFNQKTQNVLIEEFGDDSENWINKSVKVILKKDTIAGKKVEIAYFVVDGWKLDEYGELVKEGQKDYPTEEINPEDIPF
jgi:hypothetical protein